MQRENERDDIPYPTPFEELRVEDVRFFVGGHGRSGTTWLERTLNSHPEVLCLGPGMLFGRDIGEFGGRQVLHKVLANSEELRDWHEGLKNFRGEYQNPWTRPGEFQRDADYITRAVIDVLMRRELTESDKRVLGDRTPHHISQLPEIHSLYPEAKVIHAVRDGRDVAVSGMHHRIDSSDGAYHTARKGQPVELSSEELEIRDAYLQDREAFLSSGRSIFTEDQIRQRTKSWNRVVRKGRDTGRHLFGDNYFEFHYEDHLNRPGEALESLLNLLEVETNSQVIERMVEANRFENVAGRPQGQEDPGSFHRKGVAGDWKEVFTERDKQIFKEEAGELLIELNYENDNGW